jgi:hypothetical protein
LLHAIIFLQTFTSFKPTAHVCKIKTNLISINVFDITNIYSYFCEQFTSWQQMDKLLMNNWIFFSPFPSFIRTHQHKINIYDKIRVLLIFYQIYSKLQHWNNLSTEAAKLGNCNKFYFTFEFKYWMSVWIYQKFEKDQIAIHHLSNSLNLNTDKPIDIGIRPKINKHYLLVKN